MKTYTTISGDEWDVICYKVYGSEMVIDEVMHANSSYMHIAVFPAGIILNMPAVKTVQKVDDLPPWMR